MTQPTVSIAITADDKTAKGVRSAEKRMGGINRQGALGLQRYVGEIDKANARAGRSLVGTFNRVEHASSGVLSGLTSGSGGIVKRLASVAAVGETAALSMGEAAAGAGALEVAMGLIAGPGAIAAGVIAGVALATDKMASSWAKGVLGASNLASSVGIATAELQKFQAAGERVGVDKGASAGALSGLAKTLDEARYGQNANAAGTLALLGIKTKLKADGQVDTMAMLPEIAAAMQRQTPYGARKIANNLGGGDALLPILRQGPKAFGADMDDAGRYAGVSTKAEEESAKRWVHDRTRVGQMIDRATMRAGATAAGLGRGALDMAGATGARMIDDGGASIAKGAETFASSVVNKFVPAANAFASAVHAGWQGGGRFNQTRVQRMAAGAQPIYRAMLAHGDRPETAAAWAAAAYAESGGDPHRQQPGRGKNLGYGLFQWDAARRANFQKVMGHSIYGRSVVDQLRFRDYELAHNRHYHKELIDRAQGSEAKADAITRYYERPKETDRDAADRSNLAGAIRQPIDMHHHHHITIENKRMTVRTTSPGTKRPAVHYQLLD